MRALPGSVLVLAVCFITASCGSPDVINYAVSTKSPLACCRTMRFSVANFASVTSSREGSGVEVRFLSDTLKGHCLSGGEAPLVIVNHTDAEVLIPTSRELDAQRIKIYPWRLVRDEARGASIRVARQIQFGDLPEQGMNARLQLMRLPAGHEVRLTAWAPGPWMCTKPTEVFADYLSKEIEPDYYSHHYQTLRTAPAEQARDLVTPIGLRYDIVYLNLKFLETLPVASRVMNGASDSLDIVLDVREEPAGFLNAAQSVATSNVITMVIAQ